MTCVVAVIPSLGTPNADANFKISFARRNSKFSRSSCFSRARSSVVSPGRLPASRSACRTQWRKVSAANPSFPAIERIAAHCESYSLPCSRTIRTARSRTSGENLLDRAMAPSSQGMEPPGNPARFIQDSENIVSSSTSQSWLRPRWPIDYGIRSSPSQGSGREWREQHRTVAWKGNVQKGALQACSRYEIARALNRGRVVP